MIKAIIKQQIYTIIFLLALNYGFGQKFSDCNVKNEPVFVRAENVPSFTGSLTEYFKKELLENLKNYNGSI